MHAHFDRAQSTLYKFIDKIIHDCVLDAPTAPKHDFLTTLLEDPLARADLALTCDLLVLLVAGCDNMQNTMAWSLHELACHPTWLEHMHEEATAQLPGGQRLRLEDMHVCMPHHPPHACMLTNRPTLQRFPVHLAVFHEMLHLWLGVPKNARLTLHDNTLPALPALGYPAVPVHKGDYLLWNDWSMMHDLAVSPHSCRTPPLPLADAHAAGLGQDSADV